MNIRKSIGLILLLCALSAVGLQAERVFILFDPSCMDRMEYQQSGQPGSYVVYHVNVAPGEKLVFEVGQESGEYRGNLPTPLIGCNTGIFNHQMVTDINRGIDEAFIVNRLGNGRHTITQVASAASYQYNNKEIAYDSPKYQFRFDLQNGALGENLANPQAEREVFFEGRMEEQCLGAYIFRQFAPRSAKPHVDLVLIPQIGIIREQAGFDLNESLSNAIELISINQVPLDYRIQEICQQGNTASRPIRLSPNTSEVTPSPVHSETPEMVVKRPTEAEVIRPITTQPATTAQSAIATHTIAKGETLYSISKKYGITVPQLKQWNGLRSNLIYGGDQLFVSDPSGGVVNTTVATDEVDVSDDPPVNRFPAPYDASGQRITTTRGGIATTTDANKYHQVRTGETVASIALRYGFTEKKLREMNGLQANEYPKIGQQLRVSDCDCPDVQAVNPGLQPRGVYGYQPAAVPPPSTPQPQTPVSAQRANPNNTYPAPNAYDNAGTQPSSRPFATYDDTPVPATGTRTAPANFNATPNYNTTNPYNPNPTNPTSYNNPYPATITAPRQPTYSQGPNITNRTQFGPVNPPTSYGNSPSYSELERQRLQNQRSAATPSSYYSPSTSTLRSTGSTNLDEYIPVGKKRSHTVRDGENIYDIARRYNVSVQLLQQLNDLEPNEIVIPNQIIYLE